MRNIYLRNSSLLNFKFSCCFWCWKSTNSAIPEQLELQILLVLSKHGGAQIRTFFSRKSSGTLQKLKCHLWLLGSNSYILSRHNVPVNSGRLIKKYSCLIMLCFIFILETLEQFLSAFLTASRSVLGQCQGKSCNRPMLITACYLFLTRDSSGFS